ncbi:MAG: hypothetical protein ABH873_02525 [Candidatus Firestonebacteria bacterium]
MIRQMKSKNKEDVVKFATKVEFYRIVALVYLALFLVTVGILIKEEWVIWVLILSFLIICIASFIESFKK